MNIEYIHCSSITYAHKGQKTLLEYGIRTKVVKPPRTAGGCGYSLEIDSAKVENAIVILKKHGVKLAKENKRNK